MIDGYEKRYNGQDGCYNCLHSEEAQGSTLRCSRHGERISGIGICPDWTYMIQEGDVL